MMETHAPAPLAGGEFTLCGRAHDDEEDGPPPVFAALGEEFTCAECRVMVRACVRMRDFKVRP